MPKSMYRKKWQSPKPYSPEERKYLRERLGELKKDRAIKNNIDAQTLLVQLHDDHEFVEKVLRPEQKQIIQDYKNNKYDREKGIQAHIRVFDALQEKYNPKPTNPSSLYDHMYMYMPMTKRAASEAIMNQFERMQDIKFKRELARRGMKIRKKPKTPLASVGSSSFVMGKKGGVMHTSTGTDANPIHYVLHRHRDGSGSMVMQNAETGKVIDGSLKHFPPKAGGFEAATKAYNDLLTFDKSVPKLKKYTPPTMFMAYKPKDA